MENILRREEAVEFLRSLPDKSYDSVVTSPPYNIGVPYDGYVDNRVDYLSWTLAWVTEAVRVSRKGLMLNIGARASSQDLLFRVMGLLAENFKIQQTWIWVKSIYTGEKTIGHFKPINSDRYCNNLHEFVFLINEKGDTRLDKLAVGVPFEDKSNIARFAGNNGRDLRDRGSTWFIPYETRVQRLEHPATFPEKLVEMMLAVSNSRSVVDPFAGSGTTLIVAKRLGLPYAGADISETYVEMSRRRLEGI